MKYSILITALAFLTACGHSADKNIHHFYTPAPGTVIAADSMPIEEDGLNDFYYSVKITATDSSSKGRYTLDADYGPNEAHTEVVYPELDREIKPAIKPDTQAYSYIIGFYFSGSDSFKDYARVSARRMSPMNSQIEIKYLKAYFMEPFIKK
jgi:hypothetical protein